MIWPMDAYGLLLGRKLPHVKNTLKILKNATRLLLGCLEEVQPQSEDKHGRFRVKNRIILASDAYAIATG